MKNIYQNRCFASSIMDAKKAVQRRKFIAVDTYIKKEKRCPDQCGSIGWASSHKEKGHWLDS